MASVAELLVRIGADVTQATNALKGFAAEANASMKRAEAGSQALAVGLAAVGTAAAAFAVASVKSLAEVERINVQTAAALKSTGAAAWTSKDQIAGLADSLEKLTGIEAESIQRGENLLLTFTNVKNGVGANNDVFNQATKIMLDMSVAMGTDAAGGAIQLGKALNDPTQGITALTRVGVTFTDAQKAQIKALQESGDMMGAQRIILAELKKEFGGSAEAMGTTFTGNLNKATNAIGDIGEAIVKDAMPALNDLAKTATTAALEIASKINAIGLRDTLESWIGPSENVRLAITAVAGAVTAMLIPSMLAAGKAVAVATLPLAPYALAGAAVVALAYGLYKAWENVPHLIEYVGAAFNQAKGAITATVSSIELKVKQFGASVTTSISNMVTGIKDWLGNKLKAAFDLVAKPIETARKAFFSLYDAVVGHSYIPDMVKETGQHMAKLDQHLARPALEHTAAAKAAFARLQSDVGGIMAKFSDTVGAAGIDFRVMGDASAYLSAKVSATQEALRGLFQKGFAEASGPVQAMRENLRLLIEQQDAVKASLAEQSAMQTYADALRNVAVQEQLWGASQDTIAGKITATEQAMAAMTAQFGPASEQVAALRGQWEAFQAQLTDQAVSDAVDKVFNGIASGADESAKALEKMTPMVKGVNEALGTTGVTASHVQQVLGGLTASFANWTRSTYEEMVKGGKIAKEEADKIVGRVGDAMSALDAVGGALARGDLIGTAVAMAFHGIKAVFNLFSDVIKGIGDFFNWVGSGFKAKAPEMATTAVAPVTPPTSGGFATASIPMSGSSSGGGITINISGNTLMGDQDGERLGRLLVETMRRQGVRFA
jgi:hypothetical protein